MKKRGIIIAVAVLLATAGGLGLYYYTQKSVVVSLIDIYQTSPAEIGDVNRRVSGSGKVEVRDKVSIYLNTSQIVDNVYVKVGDSVSEGDILADYDIEQDYADLQRKLNEAEIQLNNAQLNLLSISQSADGNELVQYYSDVTNAQKNITDAEAELITARKNITDAEGDLNSLDIKISQQQLVVDDAKTAMEDAEILYNNGGISAKAYDSTSLAYKNTIETLNDLLLQKEIREKTLDTRIAQLEYAEKRLETRQSQLDYTQHKLDNSQNKLANESTMLQYNIQQNIIALNQITIEQIKSDIDKLTEKSVSPVNGNITSINAVEGGIISKGVPVVTISDTSSIIVKYEISEYDAPLIELGQKVYITTSAIAEKIYNGIVVKIAEEALEKEDSSNNEIVVPIEISITDLDDKLKIGYSVDIDIITAEAENVVNVPSKSIFTQDGSQYIYKIIDNELFKTEVSSGLRGDRSIEIISGLTAGELVVINPESIK